MAIDSTGAGGDRGQSHSVPAPVRAVIPIRERLLRSYEYEPRFPIGTSWVYVITEKRVVKYEDGLLRNEIAEIPHDNIVSISYSSQVGPSGHLGDALILLPSVVLLVGGLVAGVAPAWMAGLVLLALSAYAAVHLERTKGFTIQTQNPDVSILLPSSQLDAESERIVQEIREVADI